MGIAGRKVEVCAQTKPRQCLAWVVAEPICNGRLGMHYYLNIKTETRLHRSFFSVINWTEVAKRFAEK
jgi:superoxide dismutase